MFSEDEYKYENLGDVPGNGTAFTQYASQSRFRRHRTAVLGSPTLWIVTTILLALLSAYLAEQNYHHSKKMGTFETGFITDIGIHDRPPVHAFQHKFTGTPIFFLNGSAHDTSSSPYAGYPHPSIDAAWQRLIGQRYFMITPAEAHEMFGPNFKEFELPGGTYAAGIDVMHQLHCLNTLRKYVDYEYYGEELESEHGYTRLHIDHCIDQIRQSLQCASDRTPVPTRWYPGVGAFVVTDRMRHTCREFEGLRRWLIEKEAF